MQAVKLSDDQTVKLKKNIIRPLQKEAGEKIMANLDAGTKAELKQKWEEYKG